MLKIYFDWNCITHSKNKYPYILNIAEECGDRFIFPFSNAHLRDLLVSKDEKNKYFASDLEILERICGKHYLLFEDGQMLPKFATPQEVIELNGKELESLQKSEIISPEQYSGMKRLVRSFLPPEILKRIQGASEKEVIKILDNYIETNLPNYDFKSFLSLGLANNNKLIDAEARFKTMCMALEMFGFRPEKRDKRLMNIDADASHIFYAGHCDIFVTADTKLSGKAEAIFRRYNYQTKIIRPEELESLIVKELQKEYSIEYMSELIDSYGVPRIINGRAHYKLIPNHIFGMFNVCHKLDSFWGYDGKMKAGLFRYSFNNTPYLFYTEITSFCKFIKSLLSDARKDAFTEEFERVILSGDYERISNARFSMEIEDLDIRIEIYSDPATPAPVPMILFIHGARFLERTSTNI